MPDARTKNQSKSGTDRQGETLRLAQPETLVEHRPTEAMPTADEMFLSPRVLDAGAFARYADTLKSLISDARQGARDLQDSAADADEMTLKCGRTAEQIKSRVEAGARIVTMIDQRAERAERLLDTVRETLPDAETLQRSAEKAAGEALSAAQSRADAIARGVETKADLAASDATRRLEQTAAKIEARLAAVAQHASEQADRLEQASATIDARIAEVESRLSSVSERTEEAAHRTQTELEPVLARAEQAAASIEATVSTAQQAAEIQATRLTERIQAQITPAQEACDAVLARLSIDPNDPDPTGSVLARLDDLVARSEQSLAQADRATSQLGELAGQAERVRSDFGTWLLEAATNLDILEARRERLVGPLAEAADRIAKVSPTLKDDLDAAALRLDQLQTEQTILREAIGTSSVLARQSGETLNNQAAQMRALIEGSMRTLTQRVEQAGVWLGELIQRAETLGGIPDSFTKAPAAPPAPDALLTPHATTEAPASFTNPGTPPPAPQHPTTQHPATQHPTATAPAEQHEEPTMNVPTPPTERDSSPSTTTQDAPAMDTNQTAEPKMETYGLPAPPALPIDAVSFDGADVVFGDDDGVQAAD